MAYVGRTQPLVLVFDVERRKCSLNGGPWVNFKGCISEERFKEIIEIQKRKDEEEKPPPPIDDNRDGYWVCTSGSWHFCSTYPPYTCNNSGAPCP